MKTEARTNTRAALMDAIAIASDEEASMLLSRLGVGSGWRCFVAGPATSRLARWLAAAGALVVATDRTQTSGPGAVEISHLRVGRDALPREAFDLVVARLCLGGADPLTSVTALAGALRDGGCLYLEECDGISLVPVATGSETRLPAARRVTAACARAARRRGRDPDLGRRLPGLLRAVGLEDVGAQGRVLSLRGAGSSLARVYSLTLELLRADLGADAVADDDVESTLALLRDPDFDALSHVMISAWGRARRPLTKA